MNAVFTIVAKNYLPLAFLQAETLIKYHPDISYTILLADSANGLDLEAQPYKIVPLDILDIKNIESLEFKYNLTEFCTSVKPYYINYLFNAGFDKVIYLDPDVCIFSSMQNIFAELDLSSVVLTPHIVTPEINYTGTITEALLLHVGVFNCGFIAVRASERGRHFIKWWANRLYNSAYQDKIEALHTDQKWVDLITAFYTDSVYISNDIGRNMALWNLHERKLIYDDNGVHQVNNRFTGETTPLILFHFAGFDINNAETTIHKNHSEYSMDDFPELKPLYIWYRENLLRVGFNKYITLSYQYNFFDNGTSITVFQRRMFRHLIEGGVIFDRPFSTDDNSFYNVLKKNKLLLKNTNFTGKGNDLEKYSSKILQLNFVMRFIKRLIGFDKYSLLLKFCMRYFRPENQTFLIREYQNQYKFQNENEQVRVK